jgi:transposase
MPGHVLMSEIEIIADGGRRRRWSAAEKLRIVEETLDDRASISVVARRNGVAPNLLYRWRRLMLEGGSVAVSEDDDVTSNKVVRQLEDRVRELERQLGRKTLEAEILREALDKSRTKKPTLRARSPLRDDFR